jgi:hypothetical protein
MKKIPFIWNGENPLEHEITLPFHKIFLWIDEKHGRPMLLALLREDGSGIRVSSQMFDIAKWTEVGILEFDLVRSSQLTDGQIFELPEKFEAPITATKLTIVESEVMAESGIILTGQNGSEIIVLAGVYPYTIAVQGIIDLPHVFEPEYPLVDYTTTGF